MTPQTALWIILVISLVATAMAAPLAWEVSAEIKRAKKNLSNYTATGCVTVLLGFVSVGLWWYYALATDQVMLGVIPSVALVAGWLIRMLINFSKRTA